MAWGFLGEGLKELYFGQCYLAEVYPKIHQLLQVEGLLGSIAVKNNYVTSFAAVLLTCR